MWNNVSVIEKNKGKKIEWKQRATCLYFGDDEIMINVAKYQKDWSVSLDICKDRAGNLTIGTKSAQHYVAQVEIPAARYNENDGKREKTQIDMSEVTLTLWSI